MNESWCKVKKIHWDVKSSKIQSKCDDEITRVKKRNVILFWMRAQFS